MTTTTAIPAALTGCPQWVCWQREQMTKVPYSPRTGEKAKANDPATWASYPDALAALEAGKYAGIGFMFSTNDPFVGIDLDKCRDAATGKIEPWAQSVIKRFNSYTEVSPSGTGIHIWIRGKKPGAGCKKGKIECYDSLRYFTMTGDHLPGTPETIEVRADVLNAWHPEVFGAPPKPSNSKAAPGAALPDDAIIRKAMSAKNGAAFSQLWNGQWEGAFPSQSEADMALASHLAFWCGGDTSKIDAFFRQSGLFREKWDARHFGNGKTYGEATVEKALAGCTEFYTGPSHRPPQMTPLAQGAPAPAQESDGQLPRIYAGDTAFVPVLDAARKALTAANDPPALFVRGGRCVSIQTDEHGDLIIAEVSPEKLREHLADAATWYRMGKEGEKRGARPPLDVCKTILAGNLNFLPALTRIIRAPIIAPSGRVVCTPGYDAETRTYYAGDLELPELPEKPTEEQLWEAAGLIQTELLGDFPFVDAADAANAAGLVILPIARELIDGPTPLHLIEKPSPGSGASLIAEAVGAIARGDAPMMMTEGGDDSEWRKRITSTLTYSPEVVAIDNLRRKLDSGALSSALTTRTWTDRRLGLSENLTLPVRCVWIATGNNPSVSSEIARRCVPIRIDAKVDRPWERDEKTFRHPHLIAWTKANRGSLVWAALVLIRAWIAAGRPAGSASLGSYEDWARVIGGILEHTGICGFLQNRNRFYERADRDTSLWRAFITAWWEKFREQPVGAKDLWTLIEPTEQHEDPVDPPVDLGRGSDRSQRVRFGQALTQAVDRRFTIDGQTLIVTPAGTRKRAAQFSLKV